MLSYAYTLSIQIALIYDAHYPVHSLTLGKIFPLFFLVVKIYLILTCL